MANKGQWTKAIVYSPLIINTLSCQAVTISIEKWTIMISSTLFKYQRMRNTPRCKQRRGELRIQLLWFTSLTSAMTPDPDDRLLCL